MDDDVYDNIVNFVSDGKYPPAIMDVENDSSRNNQKRCFRSLCKKYDLSCEKLYHEEYETQESTKRESKRSGLPVPRKRELKDLFGIYHDNYAIGAHFGRDKTYDLMRNNYYWVGMKKDIAEYIAQCDRCQRFNPATKPMKPQLHCIPVPTKVWSLVGIDIMGKLPKTDSGNEYIVAVSDHFSKWCEAKAIPDKSAISVARFMYELICRDGSMDTLISDQGREFVNQVIDELESIFGFKHRITSCYHPQANGQRERDNRTLKAGLFKCTEEQTSNWDMFLDGVLMAHRIKTHASTKFTPFELMYGRQCKLPTGPIYEVPVSEFLAEVAAPDTLNSFQDFRRGVEERAAENIKKAQARQKKHYDKRHSSASSLEEGLMVLIKNRKHIGRLGDKLEPKFLGPYMICKDLGKGRFRLQNIRSGARLKNAYHASLLKRYQSSDGQKAARRSTDTSEHSRQKSARAATATRTYNPTGVQIRKQLVGKLGISDGLIRPPACIGSPILGKPVKIRKVRGDGNCYFRAISLLFSGTEDHHKRIRDSIVAFMRAESKALEDYLRTSCDGYLKDSSMDKDGSWATDAEILATAKLLELDIEVFTGRDWGRYPASFSHFRYTDSALYLDASSGDHFNPVLGV